MRVALTVALAETYSTIYNVDMPEYVCPVLAVTVIGTAFGYAHLTNKNNRVAVTPTRAETYSRHYHDMSSSTDSKTKEETESL